MLISEMPCGIGTTTAQTVVALHMRQQLSRRRDRHKGHVYAYREELDQWMKVKGKKIAAEEASTGEKAPKEIDVAVEGRRWFPSKLVWIVPILILAAAIGLAVNRRLFFSSPHPRAADWRRVVEKVRSEHHRKTGFMPGFEEVVAGSGPSDKPSFLERAKAHWGERK